MGSVFKPVVRAVTRPLQTVKNIVSNPVQAVLNPTSTLASALPGDVQKILSPVTKPLINLESRVSDSVVPKQEATPEQANSPQTSANVAPSAVAAANVGVPTKEDAEEDKASSKRKTRSRGKKTLTVSRESGKGVNV